MLANANRSVFSISAGDSPEVTKQIGLMAIGTAIPVTVTAVNSNGVPSESFPRISNPSTRFSVSKPSWIVRTESNVWKGERRKPDPPCVVCGGSGKVDCHRCFGKGRTNSTHLAMLPKGEWPKWCKACGGSGHGYCSRCLGTGEYRETMGFRFMTMASECKKSSSEKTR